MYPSNVHLADASAEGDNFGASCSQHRGSRGNDIRLFAVISAFEGRKVMIELTKRTEKDIRSVFQMRQWELVYGRIIMATHCSVVYLPC